QASSAHITASTRDMLHHVIRSTAARSVGSVKPAARALSSSSWLNFSGSSLLQRLTSFFVGMAVGGGATMYLVRRELQDSNRVIGREIEGIKARIQKLEKK